MAIRLTFLTIGELTTMTLRDFHRLSALAIASYAVLHIANHLAGIAGVDYHIAFMKAIRPVYRQAMVETLLLFCVAFQTASGLYLALRGWKQRHGFVPWLQAGSGLYLAFFLLIHVSAVLFGRAVLNLDTNFYYAAAGFYVTPYQFFFAPYYFLAVFALFTHVGCAAYWQFQSWPAVVRTLSAAAPAAFGLVASLLIVLSLGGMLYPVDIPAKYKATYAPSR